LRPTAEGAANEESDDKQRGEKASAPLPATSAATPASPAPVAPAAAEPPTPVAAAPSPPPAMAAEAEPQEAAPPAYSPFEPENEPARHASLYEQPAAPSSYPLSSYVPSYDEPNEQDELFPEEEDNEDEEIPFDASPALIGEGGEAEVPDSVEVEKDETPEAAEKRGRRSRRSRGGRRRSGRSSTAAPTNGGAATEEEDDELPEETFEEPAPAAPVAAIAPRRRERERERERERPEERERERESFFPTPAELMPREIYVPVSVSERPRGHADERKIALFCDLENIALGVRDSDVAKFDINLVLERLLEKGKIIVKKAYADWERYSDYKRPFHEAAIELIDIPQKYYSGKNSADIKMVVDAMDLSYSKEHLDTFVLLSGDSDFSPLVSKLKENNKYVIGIGVKNSSSNLLVDNCDEFIYYEDVWRDSSKAPQISGLNKKAAEAFSLMVESIQALTRENKDVLWGSMIKQTMQRKKPSFNEGYYGYSTFSELLEDAERKNIIKLKKDQRSGTYIVTGFAKR
jgi:uncharacterized protein (TIGR00288 family)